MVVTGIAGLIWSQYPNASRDWVRQRLRWSAHNYPARNNVVGFGVPNAMKAVGGMYRAWLDVELLELQECWRAIYRTTSRTSGGDGPFSRQWAHGPTTIAVTDTVPMGGQVHREVQVTDASDGTFMTSSRWLTGPAWCHGGPGGPI
jgi:hypothetical protein